MADVDINIVAVIAATAVNMIVGATWYAKGVFGASWQKLVGLSNKDLAEGDKVSPMIAMLVMAIVQVLILLHFVTYTSSFYPDYSNVSVGLLTGVLAWLGFVLPALAGAYMLAGRRKKLLAIDATYSLVVLVINGILLAVIR